MSLTNLSEHIFIFISQIKQGMKWPIHSICFNLSEDQSQNSTIFLLSLIFVSQVSLKSDQLSHIFKPIFGLSDKIGLLVPLEAVQACCYIEKKVKSPSKNGRVIKWLGQHKRYKLRLTLVDSAARLSSTQRSHEKVMRKS